MKWMNDSEIEEAKQLFEFDPILGPAAQFLADYRDLVDANSDGWPHWGYGVKCAGDLCEMLSAAILQRYRHDRNYVKPTWAEMQQATKKVVTFVRRCKQTKHWTPPTLETATQMVLTPSQPPSRKTKVFQVIGVSSNSNNFGLHQHILLAQDGTAYIVLITGQFKKAVGDRLTLKCDGDSYNFGAAGMEAPSRLPASPVALLAEVWK